MTVTCVWVLLLIWAKKKLGVKAALATRAWNAKMAAAMDKDIEVFCVVFIWFSLYHY